MTDDKYPCRGCKNELKQVNEKKVTMCDNYRKCKRYQEWYKWKWEEIRKPLLREKERREYNVIKWKEDTDNKN